MGCNVGKAVGVTVGEPQINVMIQEALLLSSPNAHNRFATSAVPMATRHTIFSSLLLTHDRMMLFDCFVAISMLIV